MSKRIMKKQNGEIVIENGGMIQEQKSNANVLEIAVRRYNTENSRRVIEIEIIKTPFGLTDKILVQSSEFKGYVYDRVGILTKYYNKVINFTNRIKLFENVNDNENAETLEEQAKRRIKDIKEVYKQMVESIWGGEEIIQEKY